MAQSARSTSATAEHAGRIYLDLADEHWRAVEIGPDGWRVVGLSAGALPPAGRDVAVAPTGARRVDRSAQFISESAEPQRLCPDRRLVVGGLAIGGPYPLLAISGEQGSAKTVLCKLLKALIDPNAAPVRALSREERELMIAANNGYLLAFDNLSGLPHWLSDALCRLATGGSFAVRQLYTDDEEVLFEAVPPMLLNGIEDVISRPDLGRPGHISDLGAHCGGGSASGGRALARIRNRSSPHPERTARRGGAWVARQQSGAPRAAAAHGGFRALGRGMRNSLLARRHFRSCLCRQPQSSDREHHRSRPAGHLRAHHHGRTEQLDRERIRPAAFVRRECA